MQKDEQVQLPACLKGFKSVALVIEIDSNIYYVFYNQETIILACITKRVMQIKQQWKFPKIRDMQKMASSYFYIITQDHRIGIYSFESITTINTYVNLHKFESYFTHEIKKNIFEIQIFKNQLEIQVYQFTSNGKKSEGQFNLQHQDGGYQIIKQIKKLILSPKFIINSTRRIILTRFNTKGPYFFVKKFPENAFFIIGLPQTNQYIGFNNKIEYFNALKNTQPMKLPTPIAKFSKIYLRHNHIIVSSEDNQNTYVVEVKINSAKLIYKVCSQYDWVFGYDSNQIIALSEGKMISKKIKDYQVNSQITIGVKNLSIMNHKYPEIPKPKSLADKKIQSQVPNKYSSAQQIVEYKQSHKQTQKQQKRQQNRQQKILQKKQTTVKYTQIQKQQQLLINKTLIITPQDQQIKQMKQKINKIIQKSKKNISQYKPQNITIGQLNINHQQEVQPMIFSYINQSFQGKVDSCMSQIIKKNKQYCKNKLETMENQARNKKKASDKKSFLKSMIDIKDKLKVQLLQNTHLHDQNNLIFYYHWKTQIKQVQNAIQLLHSNYQTYSQQSNKKQLANTINLLANQLQLLANTLNS